MIGIGKDRRGPGFERLQQNVAKTSAAWKFGAGHRVFLRKDLGSAQHMKETFARSHEMIRYSFVFDVSGHFTNRPFPCPTRADRESLKTNENWPKEGGLGQFFGGACPGNAGAIENETTKSAP